MEKLTVEVELSKEEMEKFNNFIEQGCLDQKAYLKRLLLGAIENHERHNKLRVRARTA